MHSRKRYLWGYSLALVSALSFSTKGVIAKLLYAHGLEPVGMLALRFAIAMPLFWALLFLFPSEKVRPRDIGYLILSGILGIYLSALADFYGLKFMEASLERLVVYTYPIFVLLFSALFFKEKLSRAIILPLIVTYFGLAIALEAFTGGLSGNTGLGAGLVLFAAIAFAGGQVVTESLGRRVSSVKLSAVTTTAAAAAFITTYFLQGGGPMPASATAWGLLVLLSALATFVPLLSIVMSIKIIGASHTAMIGFIGPVSTAIIARIFLGEALTTPKVIGMAILLVGVYLITRSRIDK
jgi:drug/metabolite transporter (DMT)-like permease